MSDQLRDIVTRMVEAGESEADIAAVIQRLSASQPDQPAPPKDYAKFGPMQSLMRDQDEGGVHGRGLPEAMAGAAAVATGGGIVLPAIAAGGAGYLGARLRGDPRGDAAFTGAAQGALQGVGGGLVKIGARGARALMRGGIPKGIQSDFGGREVAQEALDTLAVPGVSSSAARVSRLSNEANTALGATAKQVPVLKSRKIIDGLRKLYDDAVAAKMPDRAGAIGERAGEIRREVGSGLDGPGQLARKGIKQYEGKTAMKAPNSKMAGLDAQLADAERDAVMSHLHETPGMKSALGLSKRRMGLDRFMKDAETTSMISRARQSVPSALLSPTGLAVTAHGVNQGSKLLDPQVIRLLDMIMNQRSNQQ